MSAVISDDPIDTKVNDWLQENVFIRDICHQTRCGVCRASYRHPLQHMRQTRLMSSFPRKTRVLLSFQ